MRLSREDYGDAIETIGIGAYLILDKMEEIIRGENPGDVVEYKGVKWFAYGTDDEYDEIQFIFRKLLKHKVIVASTGALSDLLDEMAKKDYPGQPWESNGIPYYSINARENWRLPAPRKFK